MRDLGAALVVAVATFGSFAGPSALAQGVVTPPVAVAAASTQPCETRTDVLGVSRVVEIDTATGPRFGQQYPGSDFLEDHEVILTFDDGPMRRYTGPILDALDEQCVKATFFSVGRMAISDRAMLQEVARRGHTLAIHTWSHQKLSAVSATAAKREIELGLSAVSRASGVAVAPFFRFPYLAYSGAMHTYLAGRGIATFGIDVDSRDFRTRSPGTVMRNVLSQLEARRRGIVLFHDIQPATAGALSSLLAELKARGFKVVHAVAKSPAVTLPEYDAIADKMLKAKETVAKGDPLSTRAVTWPVNEPEGTAEKPATAAPQAKPALPWAAPASPTAANRKPDWGNLDNDPWRLRTLGE